MKILLLDTSCPQGLVAIADENSILAEVYLNETMRHGEILPKAVSDASIAAKVALDEIDHVVVGQGPGSFVGVRIAMAYAKGFCVARKIPLLGVSTLEALACQPELPLGTGIVAIDARRNEFYWQEFSRQQTPTGIMVVGTPPPQVGEGDFASTKSGEGTPPWPIVGINSRGPTAQGLWHAAMQKWKTEGFDKDETDALQPIYVRAPDAKPSTNS